MAMEHYNELLRRHIVGETDIDGLCAEIYAQHRTAINLIIGKSKNLRQRVYEFFVALDRESMIGAVVPIKTQFD